MSAPLEKFQYFSDKCFKKTKNEPQHYVTIMNNSLQIAVLTQLTVLTLFNDTCVNCGKTFTHYIVVEKTDCARQPMYHNGKKVHQIIPCTIEKNAKGEVQYILFTKDHIIPQSKFGANRLVNYQLMCQPCNLSKSSQTSDDEYKYGEYTKGIFNMNLNMIKRVTHGKRKVDVRHIERTKGGLIYAEFADSQLDGYYTPSGQNVLVKGIVLKNVLDN